VPNFCNISINALAAQGQGAVSALSLTPFHPSNWVDRSFDSLHETPRFQELQKLGSHNNQPVSDKRLLKVGEPESRAEGRPPVRNAESDSVEAAEGAEEVQGRIKGHDGWMLVQACRGTVQLLM